MSVGADATNLAHSVRSHRLVFSRNQNRQNIYRVALQRPGVPTGEPERLIASTRSDHQPDYSPRGDAVAFASTRSGSEEIWISNPDGTGPRQLTSMGGPLTEIPRWSPDGSMIAFDSRREGFSDVHLVSSQGGAPLRLTDHSGYSFEPRWSRDGRWVYFGSHNTGRGEVWKIPASGGEAIQVTRNGGVCAQESPDGRWLYYARSPGVWTELWRAPIAGGPETPVLKDLSHGLNYVVTDEGIYFVQARSTLDRVTIAFLDLRSQKVKPVLRTNGRLFIGLTISPDGRSLLWSQVDEYGADLILVENFR